MCMKNTTHQFQFDVGLSALEVGEQKANLHRCQCVSTLCILATNTKVAMKIAFFTFFWNFGPSDILTKACKTFHKVK